MTDSQPEQSNVDAQSMPEKDPYTPGLGRIFGCLLMIFALGSAVGVGRYWMLNKPKAERMPHPKGMKLVQAQPIALSTKRVTVRALGTVQPARTIALSPRVAGRVIRVSKTLVPGSRLSTGDEILQLDPQDFEIAKSRRQAESDRAASDCTRLRSEIARMQTNITKADCALQIEMGQQAVAAEAYKRLGTKLSPEDEVLVLRKPELAIAQANCAAAVAAKATAEASLNAAEAAAKVAELAVDLAVLDLNRTVLRAPANVIVTEKLVDLGSQVSAATPVARLVGTDEYWVEVSVPVDQLKWVKAPGADARIYHEASMGKDQHRRGQVLRMVASLEPRGRMARLLVSMQDPLSLAPENTKQPALILDAYVRVEIDGTEFDNVASIPRAALHDGDKVWIKSPEKKLEIRAVTIAWSDAEHVYVTAGLKDGELLITSDIGTPVQGMAVRTADEKPTVAPGGPPGGRPGGHSGGMRGGH